MNRGVVELSTAANGYAQVSTFSLWQRLRLGFLLTFRHGFGRSWGPFVFPVADEGIYPNFIRGKKRLLCGYDNWVGSYFLADDPESDRFLREFYYRHVNHGKAVLTCCQDSGWTRERDLGCAEGFECILGKCTRCGTPWMNVFCGASGITGYERVAADDIARFQSTADEPELKEVLRQWVARNT